MTAARSRATFAASCLLALGAVGLTVASFVRFDRIIDRPRRGIPLPRPAKPRKAEVEPANI